MECSNDKCMDRHDGRIEGLCEGKGKFDIEYWMHPVFMSGKVYLFFFSKKMVNNGTEMCQQITRSRQALKETIMTKIRILEDGSIANAVFTKLGNSRTREGFN